MKKTLITLLLGAFSLPAGAANISLVVNSPASPGSSFDVLVQATNVFAGRPGDLVIGYGFNVTVGNGSIFSYTGEDAGPLFFDVPSADPMVFGFSNDPGGIGVADFSEPLTLATLHFSALAAGTTTIGVTDASVSDPNNRGLLFASLPNAPIAASISVDSATPEPGTFLTGGGFAVLLLLARRFRQ
jgi:hypothetical protein